MTQDKPKPITAEDVARLFEKPNTAYLEEHHYTETLPIKCKWCGSADIAKYGVRDGIQEYICLKCRRKFNAKDAPYAMRTPVEQIGAGLDMYYTGSSLTDIAHHLDVTYHNPVDRSTVYHWLMRFTKDAIRELEPLKPKVSDIWVADETALKFQARLYWIWDIIDSNSRFLLATYVSPNRGTREARTLMELASTRAGQVPKKVITDKLASYIDGIELAFGADTKHIQSSPFGGADSTNIIERFQGTIKERTKVLWGFKTLETTRLLLAGFGLHYNFFRPHISLNNRTPAEAAKIKSPVKSWAELVRKVGLP